MLKALFKRKKSKNINVATLPNFVCIGAQKAGTTWLYEMLKRHPDIGFAVNENGTEIKEVHYWDLKLNKGLDWYKSLFSARNKINGDITPSYSILDENRLQQFYEVLPDVKLVLVIRNPIDRAWSLALMNLKNDGLDKSTVNDEWFINQFENKGAFLRGDYPNILARWRKLYSNDQLLVLNYDELSSNPKRFLLKISNHIGLNPEFFETKPDAFFTEKVFANDKLELTPKLHNYLLKKYSDVIDQTEKLTGWDIQHWKTVKSSKNKQTKNTNSLSAGSLVNTGMEVIGNYEELSNPHKTIVVVGIARGGTSMVAGTLNHLGLFGGEKTGAPVFEDVDLAEAFESNNSETITSIVEKYNSNHSSWFFKRPSVIDYLDKVHLSFRNPVYIFIFKDIFSVSNRNQISMQQDVLKGLEKAQSDYNKMLKFIRESNDLNAMLLSYEKVLTNKKDFIDKICSLMLNDQVSEAQKQKALDFIEPSPEIYLDLSRKSKTRGAVESISANKITGWTKGAYDNAKVKVELFVNYKSVATNIADKTLPFLNEQQQGYGFVFELEEALKDGDKIFVKPCSDINGLTKVPLTYEASEVKSKVNESGSLCNLYSIPWMLTDTSGLLLNEILYSIKQTNPEIVALLDDGSHSSQTSKLVKQVYDSDDFYSYWNEQFQEGRVDWICSENFALRYLGLIPISNFICFMDNPVHFLLRQYKSQRGAEIDENQLKSFIKDPRNRNVQSKKLGLAVPELMAFVGVLDRLDESVEVLASFFNINKNNLISEKALVQVQNTALVSLDINEELIDLIKENNRKDFELYESACSLIDKRLPLHDKATTYINAGIQAQNERRVVGFAYNIHDIKPVKVDVYINGEHVKTIAANERRPNLMANNLHRSGYVGFSYQFVKPLTEENAVKVFVSATGQEIT